MNFKIIFFNVSLLIALVNGITCEKSCKALPSTKATQSSRTYTSTTTTSSEILQTGYYTVILREGNKCYEEEISSDVINKVKNYCESEYHGELLAYYDYYYDGCYKNFDIAECQFCIKSDEKGNCIADEENKDAFPTEIYNKCIKDGGHLLDSYGYRIEPGVPVTHDYTKPVVCEFCAEGSIPHSFNYGFVCKEASESSNHFLLKNLPFLSTSEIPSSPDNSSEFPVKKTNVYYDTSFPDEAMKKIKDYCENILHGVAQLRDSYDFVKCTFCNDKNLKYDFYHNICKPIGEEDNEDNNNCTGTNEISISEYEKFNDYCLSNSGKISINYRRKSKNCYIGASMKCEYPKFYSLISTIVSRPAKGLYRRTVNVGNNKMKRAKEIPITRSKTLPNITNKTTTATTTFSLASKTTTFSFASKTTTFSLASKTTTKAQPTNRICRKEDMYGVCYSCWNGEFRDPKRLDCSPDEETEQKINLKKEECEAAGYYFTDDSSHYNGIRLCIQCGHNFRYDDTSRDCIPIDAECSSKESDYGIQQCKSLGGKNELAYGCNLTSVCKIRYDPSLMYDITNTTVTTATTITTTKTIPTEALTNPTTTISPKYCDPQTITITEKETITKKETITVTITRGEVTTTPKEQEENCSVRYAQCGGSNYQGPTCCQSGSKCVRVNEYYSQCL